MELMEQLEQLIHQYKAGSATHSGTYWIHLKPREIAEKFEKVHGLKISNSQIKKKLKEMGFKYRKMSKNLPTGHYQQRDEQFEIIFSLVALMSLNSPIISIDCKKKEKLGNLYRDGKVYTQESIEVYDHDYEHLADGKVIPHGIYDLQRNEGYITIGTSHETAAFIVENLIWWWEHFGIHYYPDCQNILILCDAGGANSYRHHAFKKAILELAQKIGKDIIICHYPPYASKWNPIEHRLFAQTHYAIQGVVFDTYDTVKMLFEKTQTTTGLKVFVRILEKHFDIGIKVKKEEIESNRIQFHKKIPELSYRIAA
jgi:Rhodopirellula transposase DDE domain